MKAGLFCTVFAMSISLGFSIVPTNALAKSLFFTDIFHPAFSDGFIRRVNTDGTGLNTVVNVGGGLRGIALDEASENLYWTDVDNDTIKSGNFDGAGDETLINSDLLFTFDIEVDPAAKKLYYGDQTADAINTANLDGSNHSVLINTPYHSGLEIDDVNGKLYWSTSITSSEGDIFRSNLDGTAIESVITNVGKPSQLALDTDAGKIYWTDFVQDVVM